jgi:DNA-binding PucR family transcriptional regulator
VVASASAHWVWVPGDEGRDVAVLQEALEAIPGVRSAIGPTLPGIDGFRRSHSDATAPQRLLHHAALHARVATYDDVQVVALATQDEDRARGVGRADARAASPLVRGALRDASRVPARGPQQRASRALSVHHRNTVLSRLKRADELLPAPLAGRNLQVGVALEIARWLSVR